MIGNRRILGLIPARGDSKGAHRKNIRPVGGLPLLAWTANAALASRYLDEVVVSSEDREIIETALTHGCSTPFVRPDSLALDDTSAIDVALHALDALDTRFDYLVLLQPTSPLRTSEDIDTALEICEINAALACVSVAVAEKSPWWMYLTSEDGFLVPLMGESPSPARRQDSRTVYVINGAIYVARCEWLRENRTFVGKGTVPYVMPQDRSLDIDTEEDLHYFDFLIKERATP